MAIVYSWDCKTVDCYPTKDEQGVELTDVVYNVHWILTGTEESGGETYTATSIGTQVITTDDIDPNTFTPFDQLTNEIATGWCKEAMGEEQVADLEANVATQLANKINPPSVTLVIGEPVPTV